MMYLKARTMDGEIELFNLDKIMTITPKPNGTTKILMAANMYWYVETDSITYCDCINEILTAIKARSTI